MAKCFRNHWLFTTIAAASFALVTTWILSGQFQEWYYASFRGGDLTAIKRERVNRLEAIWDSLCRFRSIKGRFPSSEGEWAEVESDLQPLLRPPQWSEKSYELVPSGFEASELAVIVRDPGTTWPGVRSIENERTPSKSAFPDLFNDGSIGRRIGDGKIVRWKEPRSCDSKKR